MISNYYKVLIESSLQHLPFLGVAEVSLVVILACLSVTRSLFLIMTENAFKSITSSQLTSQTDHSNNRGTEKDGEKRMYEGDSQPGKR